MAIVSNIGNSAIVDLMSGGRVDLLGYTNVVAATIARDGFIYAAVWDRHWSANELQIAKIDPQTMTLVAQQSTGMPPRVAPIDGQAMLATPDGGVYLYLQLSGGESQLYRVDAATASATLIATPRELGVVPVVGVDGKIYFAQGYGQNRVSVFDPATGAFDVDVSWLRAPAGSYIVGLVAR